MATLQDYKMCSQGKRTILDVQPYESDRKVLHQPSLAPSVKNRIFIHDCRTEKLETACLSFPSPTLIFPQKRKPMVWPSGILLDTLP